MTIEVRIAVADVVSVVTDITLATNPEDRVKEGGDALTRASHR